MAEALVDNVPSFVIRELTGEKRELVLTKRALPYPPYTLTGTQRTEFTWIPGSPVATVQVLGASEEETSIKGMWKNRFISEGITFTVGGVSGEDAAAKLDGDPLVDVTELAAAVDDIRRKGQLLEVIWGTHARHGIMVKFVQDWTRVQDMDWEITFAWISQAESDQGVGNARREVSVSEISTSVGAAVEALSVASFSPFAVVGAFNDDVNASVNRLQSAVSALEDSATNQADLLLGTVDALRRVAGICEFLRQEADILISTIEAHVDRTILNVEDVFDIPIGAAIDVSRHNRVILRGARDVRALGAFNRALIGDRVNPALASTFIARENQDLRDVSTQFYGTPEHWKELRQFNHMSTSKLESGQLVFVPSDPSTVHVC